MSDRVRFYIEGSVKELKDLKQRGIFEQGELSHIMKRRTEYEHRLLSRKVKHEDFLAYAKFEMQVDRLRMLRIKRLRLGTRKSISDWAGSRRINFILERGTKRFPANLKLWMALIEYAHKQQSVNVVNRALASMLRLHTTEPEVWVYVSKYQMEENASVPEARAVLQRGIRFNPSSQYLWLEYMRLELIYVAKILARRQILGIDHARKEEISENATKLPENTELTVDDLVRANFDELRDLPDVNIDVLGNPETNPALMGDVALTVYDAALARFSTSLESRKEFAQKSLALFEEFTSLNRIYLCSHVLDSLHGGDDEIEAWRITLPIRFCDVKDLMFPDQLRLVFNLYSKSCKSIGLKQRIRDLLASRVLESEEADEQLKQAVNLFGSRL